MKISCTALSFILFILLSCESSQENKNRLPNIIIICADDLGWSDIGCYGSEINTPHLDRLASEGMRFTQFHNTSKCMPSRAALITGAYAQDCNYHKTHKNPISNAVTIGEVLRTVGYRTLWSGKHHGKENPIYRGFDHYYGLKDGCCNYFNPGNQRKGEPAPARKRTRYWCIDSTEFLPYTPEAEDFYTTDYFTKYAIKWLDEEKDSQKPFFLYLAYTAPHDPLMAWPKDIDKYKDVYKVGYDVVRQNRYRKQSKTGLIDSSYQLSVATFSYWNDLSDKDKEIEAQKMAVYAAMIDRMDQNIGILMNHLEESNQLNNTLIFFVSDNGASAEVVNLRDDNDNAPIGSSERYVSLGKNWANVCNTPFRYFKNYSYEGGINTPMIAWWPDHIKANSISRFPGHMIDFMATIIDITDAKYPKLRNGETIVPYKGQSLLPVFEGEEIRGKPLFWSWAAGKAARNSDWKIVKHGHHKDWELYNMKIDPCENNNVAMQFPEIVQQLDSLYLDWEKYYQ